jgi:hypothetical protein
MTIDTDKLKALALAEFLAWAATDEGNCDRHDLRQNPAESHERIVDGETFISFLVERDWTVWQAAQRGLIAERDELRAEVERLKTERDTFRHGHSLASNRCCELEEEVERLRADAGRYRWMRDVGDQTWTPMARRVPDGAKGIDAAIDAAIEKEKA